MGKILKLFFMIGSIVVLIIVAAAVILPLVISPNVFKPEIETAVKNITGRTLTIEGDLELSVFPWLGLSTGKLILSNAAGFPGKAFAVVDESNIKVKLIPLLSKKIELKRIDLKGLMLNLEKNEQGVNNWSDLIETEKDIPGSIKHEPAVAGQQQEVPMFASLMVGGISLENSQISWHSRKSGKTIEIQQLNLKTDAVAPNRSIPIELQFLLLDGQSKMTEQVALTSDLIINEKLDQFDINHLDLRISAVGEKLPGGKLDVELTADVLLNLENQTLNVSKIQLGSGNLIINGDLTGETILDHGVYQGSFNAVEFSPRKLLQHLQVNLPATQDKDVLKRMAVQFDLFANGESINLEQLHVNLDDTEINGLMKINNTEPTMIDFDLHIDQIDLDRYLPVENIAASGGKEVNAPTSNKPVTTSEPQISAGTNNGQPGQPVQTEASPHQPALTPAKATVAREALFPVEKLRKLNANGRMSIDNLKVNGLKMQEVVLQLDAKNGLLQSDHNVKKIYQGSSSGKIIINVRNKQPSLSFDEKLVAVQIEPMLRDLQSKVRMSGTVSATAALKGHGNSTAAIKSTLNGRMRFVSKDGVIKGFDLQKIIKRGEAMIKGEPLPQKKENDQTPYAEISAKATMTNGLISNDDFYAKSSSVRVNGKGTADIKDERLNYEVIAKWVRKEATETEPERIEGIPVHIDIGGTFSHPAYTLDIASMLTEKNRAKIDREIDKLDKKYGVGSLLKGLLNKIQK